MFFLSCYIREIQVRYFLKWWSQKRKQYLVCIILMQTSTRQDVLPLLSTSAIAWRHQHAAHTAKPCLRCHKTGRSAYLVERGRKHAFDCNSASAPYRNRHKKFLSAQVQLLFWGLLWASGCPAEIKKHPNSVEYVSKCKIKIKKRTKPNLVAQWSNSFTPCSVSSTLWHLTHQCVIHSQSQGVF